LRTIAYLDDQERVQAPKASPLAYSLRGLKPFKPFLTNFVRNTQCVNEIMRLVKTQGLSTTTLQACQDRLGDLPARSPIRQEVSHYLQQYGPMVASSERPILGSSDVIESSLARRNSVWTLMVGVN
jgi:hypothetical protein